MTEKNLDMENNQLEIWEKLDLVGEKLLAQLDWQEKNYKQTQNLLLELENFKNRLEKMEDKTSGKEKIKDILKIILQVISLAAGLWATKNSSEVQKNRGNDFYSLLNLAQIWLAEKENSEVGQENSVFSG